MGNPIGYHYGTFRKLIVDTPLRSSEFRFYLEDVNLFEGYVDGLNFGFFTNPFLNYEILLEFFISGVQFPTRYGGLMNVNFQGSQVKFSGEGALYDPLILNIQENGKCEAYQFFKYWFDKSQSIKSGLMPASTRVLNNTSNYNGLLVIVSDGVMTVFKFYNMFPLLLTGFSLAWNSQEIVNYPVHLAFDYLEVLGNYKVGEDDYEYYDNLSNKRGG